MRLDADLVRAVLLTIEDSPYDTQICLSNLQSALPDYTLEELNYTCLKLHEGGLINSAFTSTCSHTLPELVAITSLTFHGHQFLEKIRDDDHWGTVKRGLASIRNYSLSAIGTIAESVTTAAINAYLAKQ